MKQLTIAAAFLSLAIAAPAFACPMENQETPHTADKPAQSTTTTAKADKAKDAKPAPKAADKPKADKVSQK